MDIAIQMTGITMRFPRVVANDNVDFQVKTNEIHALVGENGAGKTTLMNILYGLYVPTEGEIYVGGKQHVFHSAVDAIQAGIGMVHQHFMLIPRLSVADNVVLGMEPHEGLRYKRKEAIAEVDKLCKEYGLEIDSSAKVAHISLGMQQRTEIIKVLYRKADILILDEPTAVLTPQEIDELGAMLRQFKAMGKTIIIITHKLREVIDFCDRATVLRRGRVVGTVEIANSSAEEISEMMVGRTVQLGGDKKRVVKNSQKAILEVQNLHYHDGRTAKLQGISFEIQSGEIFGIAGIDNNGQQELTEIVVGYLKPDQGNVLLNGSDITAQKISAIKEKGVGFIPQNRQANGLVLDMSVAENLMLGYQNRSAYQKKSFLLNHAEIESTARERIREFDIRPENSELLTRTLSGGNQQKVVVAREISHSSSLVVADQPTRGLDVGAIELVHNTLVEVRNSGAAVLLTSLELDEVMMLSDRIAVIFDGQFMGILDAKTATREEIGLMMTGGKTTAC